MAALPGARTKAAEGGGEPDDLALQFGARSLASTGLCRGVIGRLVPTAMTNAAAPAAPRPHFAVRPQSRRFSDKAGDAIERQPDRHGDLLDGGLAVGEVDRALLVTDAGKGVGGDGRPDRRRTARPRSCGRGRSCAPARRQTPTRGTCERLEQPVATGQGENDHDGRRTLHASSFRRPWRRVYQPVGTHHNQPARTGPRLRRRVRSDPNMLSTHCLGDAMNARRRLRDLVVLASSEAR